MTEEADAPSGDDTPDPTPDESVVDGTEGSAAEDSVAETGDNDPDTTVDDTQEGATDNGPDAIADGTATPAAVATTAIVADGSAATSATTTATLATATDGDVVYQWAPPEPAKRKRHGGLWAGGIAIATVVGVVAASLVLIAPGTAIAGVQVGGMTPGAAAEAVQNRLLQTEVVLTGSGGDAIVTGAELGAHVDAKALADEAFAKNPMWNPTAWFGEEADADITLDEEKATATLRKAAPSLFTDPVDASISFDAAAQSYTVTPAEEGSGIDVDAVHDALHTAFAEGRTTVDVRPQSVAVDALTTTPVAQAGADMLNGMLANAGFYVGEERTVPIAPETLASWLTVSADDRGAIQVTADVAAIQAAVDALPGQVNRAPVPTRVLADANGKVLNTISEGVSGRTLGETTTVAEEFAAQLAKGDAVYTLPVTEQEPGVEQVKRSIEVNLSQQRVYLRENGEVIDSSAVSTGTPGHVTITGTYRIVAKLAMQNMGNPDLTKPPNYYTKNVPWVMYFNGDQALHGAYWHNNFGHVMSHGCVNLPVSFAKRVYDWAPMGTPVWVHY